MIKEHGGAQTGEQCGKRKSQKAVYLPLLSYKNLFLPEFSVSYKYVSSYICMLKIMAMIKAIPHHAGGLKEKHMVQNEDPSVLTPW